MIRTVLCAVVCSVLIAAPVSAQNVPVRDLTTVEGGGPVRLVGYGLVTGLSGTGDRVTGHFGARHTVQSIVNLLRNFDVQVPENLLRTRNVAAVLVTAEVSPYLRSGGRFDVHVSSIGDAQSLRGGVLWMTPLVTEVGGASMAVAQGPMVISEVPGMRSYSRASTSGRIPDGGIVEGRLPSVLASEEIRLLLRDPDIGTAQQIASAIDNEIGTPGTATIEDPGSITIASGTEGDRFALIARIGEVQIRPPSVSRLLVDSRDGTVVAGSDIVVGDGTVSVDGITLVIGGRREGGAAAPSDALPSGSTVGEIADALKLARASASQSAAVFLALRDAGAIRADVIIR